MCDRKLGCFFFLRIWVNKYDASDSVYFCLCLADSVAREIQKTKRILIVLFCLLVASLRFSLMYPCVQFVVFFGSPTVIGKMNNEINRSVASRRLYFLLSFLLWELPWTFTSFFVHQKIKISFSITFTGSCTSENNCSGQRRRESMSIHAYVLDITSLKQKTV